MVNGNTEELARLMSGEESVLLAWRVGWSLLREARVVLFMASAKSVPLESSLSLENHSGLCAFMSPSI